MKKQVSHPIVDDKSINESVGVVRQYCNKLGFDKLSINLVSYAVSEIATNVIKYASNGWFTLTMLQNGNGISLKVTDNGKGIDNIESAMEDGFSTDPSSLGIGLGVAKRAMDYFHIESKTNVGTTVLMEKWLPVPRSKIEYSAISLPDSNYVFNGDGYLFQEYKGNSLFAAIIDGLGEGINAWKTTEGLKTLLANNYMMDIKVLIKKCEEKIRKDHKQSGAAIGLLKITPNELSYVGVGDTFIKVYSDKPKSISSQNGIVGAFALRTIVKKTMALDAETTIILCTDGIQNRMNRESVNLISPAHEIASFIFNNYRRENGDATVMVIKFK